MKPTILGNTVTPHVELRFTNLAAGSRFRKKCYDTDELHSVSVQYGDTALYRLDEVIDVIPPSFSEVG